MNRIEIKLNLLHCFFFGEQFDLPVFDIDSVILDLEKEIFSSGYNFALIHSEVCLVMMSKMELSWPVMNSPYFSKSYRLLIKMLEKMKTSNFDPRSMNLKLSFTSKRIN